MAFLDDVVRPGLQYFSTISFSQMFLFLRTILGKMIESSPKAVVTTCSLIGWVFIPQIARSMSKVIMVPSASKSTRKIYLLIIALYFAITIFIHHCTFASDTSQSLYSLLDIDISSISSIEENERSQILRSALRKQVLRYHPDKIRSSDMIDVSGEMFRKSRMAFDILQDPQKSWAYERFGNSILASDSFGSCSTKEEFLMAAMEVKGLEILLSGISLVLLFGRNYWLRTFIAATLIVFEAGFLGGLEIPQGWITAFPGLLPFEIVGFVKHLIVMSWLAVVEMWREI